MSDKTVTTTGNLIGYTIHFGMKLPHKECYACYDRNFLSVNLEVLLGR